jgi:hypothetical protein
LERWIVDLDIGDLFDLVGDPGLGTITGSLYRWYMERKTRHWPVAAITFMNKARKDHIITLSYCYKVEEEVYGGYCERRFLSLLGAQRYLDRVDDGLPWRARYDPRRPERSWISM